MKLYLARHGEYNSKDLQAALSAKGVSDIEHLAQRIKDLRIPVTHIFHSEKLRAKQTAELLATGFVCEQPVQMKAGLNPNDHVSVLANEIAALDEDLLLVGHLPFMSRITSLLVVGDEYKEIIEFSVGTLVCLERIEAERWIIKWVLLPH